MAFYSVRMSRRNGRNRPSWIDPSVLYTRLDIAERVGVTDDVLSFWIKRKLLIPEPQEGSGKGVHHRFHYSQVGVAVILKALRDHFGANVATLKSLADTTQAAVGLFRRTKAPPALWGHATRLAERLGQFRRGEPVEVLLLSEDPDDWSHERRAAGSETEIVTDALQIADHDQDPTAILKLAEALGPGRSSDYEIALAILGVPLDPRYSEEAYWLLSNADGKWIIRHDADDGTRNRSDVGPAMFLPVHSMIRRAWGIPSGLTAMDRRERLKAALKDAGVEATVEFEKGRFEPQITWVREGDLEKAKGVWLKFYKPGWMQKRDGDDLSGYPDPDNYDHVYWTPEAEANR
jgi:hypothetical protein